MEPELPPTVLTDVCRAFRLGAARSVTYLRDGRVNDSFLVRTCDGAYVVRRSNAARTAGAVAFEHALMAYLSERGFPTPPLKTMIEGASFLTVDGEIYRVTTFVPGERCRADDVMHLRACASTLARYHGLVANYDLRPRPGFAPILDELVAGLSLLAPNGEPRLSPAIRPPPSRATALRPSRTTQPHAFGDTDVHDWLDGLRMTLGATCARLAEAETPVRVVVHASCRRESFVLRDGHVVAMLDYDNAHVDARALDLAIAILSFAMVRPDKTLLDVARAAAFVAAYTFVTPVASSELGLVSWYIRARILKRALARYRHYLAVPHPSRVTKLSRATILLSWLDEHEEAFRSAICGVAEVSRD